MKNRLFEFLGLLAFLNLFCFNLTLAKEFNFQVSEIQISENGNRFIGNKRGLISTNDGTKIFADSFDYDNLQNILTLNGNVEINDRKNDLIINAPTILYKKNEEKIITNGITKALISSKYTFNSEDIIFDRKEMILESQKKSFIVDNLNNTYEIEEFKYLLNEELLKAKNIILENRIAKNKDNSDKFIINSGFFDLKNQKYITKDIAVKFHKNIFNRSDNDPRIYASSATKDENLIYFDNIIFTSCKENDNCPPWSLKAKKVTHDKNKKQLIYDNAVLQIYDFPVLYFPKFFHPDPTVKRQSGFLKPLLNKSNILGSSFQIPYYSVISDDKDLTFKPTLFNQNLIMLQNEFRFKGQNSSFITDFGLTRGYKSSSVSDAKKNINHLFAKLNLDLNLEKYFNSDLSMKIEKTNNDSYLKVFEGNLANTSILPSSAETLESEIKLDLLSDSYSLTTGANLYEKLQYERNDRYQYILPYYEFSKNFFENSKLGYVDFKSTGDNTLQNTNNLKSKIVNDISYRSYDIFSNFGVVNNFSLHLKNLNTIAKNDDRYISKPQTKIMSLAEFSASYPLIKSNENYNNNLTPKISLRSNPGKMINYSTEIKKINYNNIFDINRLSLDDTFESGNSLTAGIDFKRQDISNINRYFEFKIASVIRNSEENDIPSSSTLNKENSNFFGSMNLNLDNFIGLKYDFSINNNLDSLDYNSLEVSLNKNKFFITSNYLEENGSIGTEHVMENSIGYTLDENNLIKYSTRRNKKIDLTEYYNFIYQYKNDCLTAGIEYKKTFYNDRDLKPNEDLMFSITLFPLTTIEQKFGQNF